MAWRKTATIMRHMIRLVLSIAAVALGGAASPAAATTSHPATLVRGAAPAATITLVNPKHGSRVPRSQRSPDFSWRMGGADAPTTGILELDVSTDPTFGSGRAVQTLSCSDGCPTHYQWNSSYWYLESDGCTYTPPQGGPCSDGTSSSRVFYWRVSIRTPSGTVASPTGSFHVFRPKDTTPPFVAVQAGGAHRGAYALFKFTAADETGPTREIITLSAHNQLVFQVSYGWHVLPGGNAYYSGLNAQLSSTVQPGTYTWCLTAFDQAGNHTKRCAAYIITP